MINKLLAEIWIVQVDVPNMLTCGQLRTGAEANADYVQNAGPQFIPSGRQLKHLITKTAQ